MQTLKSTIVTLAKRFLGPELKRAFKFRWLLLGRNRLPYRFDFTEPGTKPIGSNRISDHAGSRDPQATS